MLLYYYADFMKFYEIELFYENVQPDKKKILHLKIRRSMQILFVASV